jgi:hypothetical protein
MRGDGQNSFTAVAADKQRAAIDALLATLDPGVLRLSPQIIAAIPPRPPGHPQTREMFARSTGGVFDELAPARSAVSMTLDVLLNPQRAARMTRSGAPGFGEVTDRLLELAWPDDSDESDDSDEPDDAAMQNLTGDVLLTKLMRLAVNPDVDANVRGIALASINEIDARLTPDNPYHALAQQRIKRMRDDPASVELIVPITPPPGGPIGTNGV